MKRILVVGLFFILLAFSSHAQELYSTHNLEQASQEDLDVYLEKAMKLRKTGIFLSIAGPASLVIGTLLATSMASSESFGMGFGMMIAGTGVTLIGIPILITGSTRVKRIEGVKNSAISGIFIELAPCSFHNYMAHDYQPGVTLRIRF